MPPAEACTLWCTHEDCTSSLDVFANVELLAAHEREEHSARHHGAFGAGAGAGVSLAIDIPACFPRTHEAGAAADMVSNIPADDGWMPFPGQDAESQRRRVNFKRHWDDLVAKRAAWMRRREWRERSPLIDAVLAGPGRAELAERTTLVYDTHVHQLREAFADMVGVPVGELHTLHTRWPGFSSGKTHLKDKARLLAPMRSTAKRARFAEAYDAFMLAVAVPDAAAVMERAAHKTAAAAASAGGGAAASEGGGAAYRCTQVLFQCFPCVRVSLPSDFAVIKPHTDALYHHAWGTMNYYVPLTPTISGTNTLQLESKPFSYDFGPLKLEYGQCERFAGALFAHYTVANGTGRTRVSFDGTRRRRRRRWWRRQ